MKKEQIEILLTLISAWAVYGVCQNDFLLPVVGTIIILGSFLKRLPISPLPTVHLEKKSAGSISSAQPSYPDGSGEIFFLRTGRTLLPSASFNPHLFSYHFSPGFVTIITIGRMP